MRSIYIRNLPDEVVERLERMAGRERISLAALAARELEEASRRIDNLELLGTLPDLEMDPGTLVSDLEAERERR